jgi:hypothetical protein
VFRKLPLLIAAGLLVSGAHGLAAQQTGLSPSPTLPSDTLHANYAPRERAAPTPSLSPTLPSDTLDATATEDSFPSDPWVPDSEALPMTPGDSAALHELRSWIEHHPDFDAPPPARAVLAKV